MPVFSNFSSSSAQGYGQLRTINRNWIDNFQRTATTSGLGNSFDGQPWIASTGNWFINASGQAQSTVNYSIASTYMGTPDVTSIVVSGVTNGTGIVFWQTDPNNWWAATLTANSGTLPYTYTGSIYNPCLTNNPGGTNDFTGSSGYCGNYVCAYGTGYYTACCTYCGDAVAAVPCTQNYAPSCCSYTSYSYCTGYEYLLVTRYSYGHICTSYATGYTCADNSCTTPTTCTGGSPGYSGSYNCDYTASYTYSVSCDYFFDSNGNAVCQNQTSCGTGTSNVCGFRCYGGSTSSSVTSNIATNLYQYNIIQSISGVISTLSSGILTNAVAITSGIASSTTSNIFNFTVSSGYLSIVGSGVVVASGLNSLTFTNTGSNSYSVLNANYGLTSSGTLTSITSSLSSGQSITVSGSTLNVSWGSSIDAYGNRTISGNLMPGTVTLNGLGKSYTISGTVVTTTPIQPVAMTLSTSGNLITFNGYANSNLQANLWNTVLTTSGSTGDFIGIINVPTSTLSGATTVGSFTGII